VITNLGQAPDVVTAIDHVEVLADGPFAVGTTWRETRTMFGKSATEEMSVSAVDPERGYTVVADSGGVHYESSFRIDPTPTGSRLTMSFGGQATSTMGKAMGALMGPLLRRSMSKALAQDLDDLARAAETPPKG
jgi:hypothetical protein